MKKIWTFIKTQIYPLMLQYFPLPVRQGTFMGLLFGIIVFYVSYSAEQNYPAEKKHMQTVRVLIDKLRYQDEQTYRYCKSHPHAKTTPSHLNKARNRQFKDLVQAVNIALSNGLLTDKQHHTVREFTVWNNTLYDASDEQTVCQQTLLSPDVLKQKQDYIYYVLSKWRKTLNIEAALF